MTSRLTRQHRRIYRNSNFRLTSVNQKRLVQHGANRGKRENSLDFKKPDIPWWGLCAFRFNANNKAASTLRAWTKLAYIPLPSSPSSPSSLSVFGITPSRAGLSCALFEKANEHRGLWTVLKWCVLRALTSRRRCPVDVQGPQGLPEATRHRPAKSTIHQKYPATQRPAIINLQQSTSTITEDVRVPVYRFSLAASWAPVRVVVRGTMC